MSTSSSTGPVTPWSGQYGDCRQQLQVDHVTSYSVVRSCQKVAGKNSYELSSVLAARRIRRQGRYNGGQRHESKIEPAATYQQPQCCARRE